MVDPYETLGVAPEASAELITKAYRSRSQSAHPDREGGSHEAMAALNVAYSIVGTPEARRRWDQHKATSAPASANLRALTILRGCAAACLGQLRVGEDLVEKIRVALSEQRDQMAHTREELVQGLARLEKLRARIRGPAENFLDMLLEAQIREGTERVPQLDEDAGTLSLALTMLGEYSTAPEGARIPTYHIRTW